MIYLLFLLLTVLFSVSYYFGGRDLFSPATVQVIGFSFATIACAYFLYSSNSLNYDIQPYTVWIIISCLLMSVVIGVFAHYLFLHIKVKNVSSNSRDIMPISGEMNVVIIAVLLATIIWMFSEILRIGGNGESFLKAMQQFTMLNSTSFNNETRFPFFLRQLMHLATVLFVIYGFNLIRFWSELSTGKKIVNMLIILLCALIGLLSGARTSTVNNIIACMAIFHLLRIQRNGTNKVYKLGFILKIGAIIVIVLWLFSIIRSFVGRTNKLGTVDYIAYYVGADIANLDLYLRDPIFTTGVFGRYTFFILNGNLRSLGLNIEPYTVHLEYQSIEGVSLGNVYTFIRTYYSDFGVVGVYLLHGIASAVMSFSFEYVKKRRGNIGILIFSLSYYSIVLSFFAERFFSNLISISFAENIILTILLYKLLLKRKNRISFGAKRYVIDRHY